MPKNKIIPHQESNSNDVLAQADFFIAPDRIEKIPNKNEFLGKGGFGRVLLRKWGTKEVAVKQLTLRSGEVSDNVKELFKVEADSMLKLRHPNVAPLWGISIVDDEYSLVMEYAPYGSLIQYLQLNPKTDWSERLGLLKGAAEGLEYLHHDKHMTHGDLKGQNILVCKNKVAKLTDFGFAETRKTSKSMSAIADKKKQVPKANAGAQSAPSIKGTYLWMAPELLTKQQRHSFASDAYAFGVLAWEVLHGREPPDYPFPFSEAKFELEQGYRHPIDATTPMFATMPARYADLITHCCHNQPDQRPSMVTIVKAIDLMQGYSLSGADAPSMNISYGLGDSTSGGLNISSPDDAWDTLFQEKLEESSDVQSGSGGSQPLQASLTSKDLFEAVKFSFSLIGFSFRDLLNRLIRDTFSDRDGNFN